jgi:hypothetical protein
MFQSNQQAMKKIGFNFYDCSVPERTAITAPEPAWGRTIARSNVAIGTINNYNPLNRQVIHCFVTILRLS